MNGLKKSDLIAERNRLEESISLQQKALDAIDIMIEYKESQDRLEQTEASKQENALHILLPGKVNLRQDCLRFVEQMNGKWFKTRDIVNMVFAAGIRSKRDVSRVRPLVSTYLGQFVKNGYLIRDNIGEGGRTEYRFRQIKTWK